MWKATRSDTAHGHGVWYDGCESPKDQGGFACVRYARGPAITPKHDAAYWDAVTAGFDFSEADEVPPAQFNRVLWAGLMGDKPYPEVRGDSGTRDDK